jgi:N-acetylneuraminate synthase/N,N'-diacetyllegionaminate synthase
MVGFKIGRAAIGDDTCYVIAEAGSNHDQNKKNALELIGVAAEAGADAIKFQLFRAETLYSRYVGKSIFEKTRSVELPPEWVPDLIDRCKSRKIAFLATPFDYESVDLLDRLGVPAFKWASGEITDIELLAHAAQKNKPIIISTGMCNLTDIELAVRAVKNENNDKIALLHCISLYPTEAGDANLRMMDTLAKTFGYPVGFSDHTLGISVALAAVARGAKILEKHFTLDKKLKSPDHPFSLRPRELKSLVESVRQVSASLGSNQKHILDKEKAVAKIGRRSIIANRPIKKGTVLSKSMLTVKRPGTGISPSLMQSVIGKTAKVKIKNDQILTQDMLS